MAKKVRGFSGIWTHGLYVSTAVLYLQSYEDQYPWEQASVFHELRWTQQIENWWKNVLFKNAN